MSHINEIGGFDEGYVSEDRDPIAMTKKSVPVIPSSYQAEPKRVHSYLT